MFDQVVVGHPAYPGGRGETARGHGAEPRRRRFPNVPSSTEAGLPELQTIAWTALFFPKGTPKPIVERINAAVDKADARRDHRQARWRSWARICRRRTSARRQFAGQSGAHAEIDKWVPLIEAAGVSQQLDEADRRGRGDARGRIRPGGAVGDRASDQGRRLSRRRRLRAGDPGPHHGRHRVARASPGSNGSSAWRGCRSQQRRVRIPTITDPRGTDFAAAHRLKQQPWMLELERRAIAAFEALGRADDGHLHQLPDDHAAGAAASMSPMATPAS